MMPPKIPLSLYILTRLRQQGVHALPGVPGDFTLKALDQLRPAGMKWIGACNELNAGYIADGYSRARGLGAVLTTYGVGELSVLNALAGSFAEWVPVVGIVGSPAQKTVEAGRRSGIGCEVHHSLGEGRPSNVYVDIARHVTIAQAELSHDTDATAEVDRVIGACVKGSRPVYLSLPADMVGMQVDAERLQQSIDVNDESNAREDGALADALLRRIYEAKQPLLLVDSGGGVRHLRHEIDAFVSSSGIPTLCMPSGNNMVDHTHANFFGVHSGPVGQIDTMPYVDGADLVLAFGPMFSDTQTLSWKVVPAAEKTVVLNKHSMRGPGFFHSGDESNEAVKINLKALLAQLTARFDRANLTHTPDVSSLGNFRTVEPPAYKANSQGDGGSSPVVLDDPIDQTSFYLRLSRYLQPNDTVVLGNATPILGGRDMPLPRGAQIIASGQWFSIGHMFPLTLGVSLARQASSSSSSPTTTTTTSTTDNPPHSIPRTMPSQGRTILLDGDGGFQVTAQELGTLVRYRIPATVFLINNAGYAYERQIHGLHEDYNDLAPWRYTELARAFGADADADAHTHDAENEREREQEQEQGNARPYTVRNYTVATWRELETLLHDAEFCDGTAGLRFVDVRVDRFDVPRKFRGVFKRAGEALGA